MSDETIEVVITIKKKDIFAFADKFGIKEYHYKNDKVTIDMTNLFDDAAAGLKEKPATSEDSTVF